MSYIVHLTEDAQQDVIDIMLYLSQFYPGTPERFYAALERNFTRLEFNPRCFPRYEHWPEYRKFNVKNYLVFYLIDDETQSVIIYRIRHGMQDLQNNW